MKERKVNNAKNNAYMGLSEKLNIIKKNIDDFEVSNKILNNEILVIFSNLKNIITKNKTKIKNINSNINDIYTNINLINSNIEKRKYSLATLRIGKLYRVLNLFRKIQNQLKYDNSLNQNWPIVPQL